MLNRVVNVLKLVKTLFISALFFLQSCQMNHQEKEDQAAKERNRSNAAAYNTQLGLSYLKQGDRPRAKRKLFAALKQEPNSAAVNTAIAYYFEETGEIDEAKSYYLKALSLAPGSGAQLNNYGTFLCRQGKYVESINYFLKAVKDQQYVHTAGAYENAGLCAAEIPDYDKSILYFTKALEQDPERKQSFYELVKIEKKLGNEKKVLDLIEKYSRFSADPAVLVLAEKIAHKLGDARLQEKYAKKLELIQQRQRYRQYSDNSGVKNEYNSHNG
ncbi:type IV pilus biogenesis/stability protein PilW [Legionella israelensis]|uniref:type IV pilus biogenesis/stability protein PilW n=1 Tax=Legionella israelensis TaxID=454 RepID=UPI00117DB2CB|nr:type IV pilus biogenesis/stability protein PilW [Legionella israelensis]QDP72511.1 type IV pilus biogenesis/stability protein PilW [Legionella israelensis]